jgi:glycosyltransferase involved in cell wall biosynthesis
MAASKPIVATSTGGIPEVVAHESTGLLVPPRDPAAMAAAIVRLLKDPVLARRMGNAGFGRVRQQFSAVKMLKETLRVYERVALHPHSEDLAETTDESRR